MRIVFENRASTILFRLADAIPADAGVYLLPANVCPVVPLALVAAKRGFEFLDIDAGNLCMNADLLRKRLSESGKPRIVGVIFVRTYGVDLDAEPLFRSLKTIYPDLVIVDDRCLCCPLIDVAELNRQGADVVLFSTGYSKHVDLGFGGLSYLHPSVPYSDRLRQFDPSDLDKATAIYKAHIHKQTPIYRDGEPDERRRALQEFQWLDTGRPRLTWDHYRNLLYVKREEANEHKAIVNGVYRRLISDKVQLPPSYHSWRFQIRVPEPTALVERIFEEGFFASRHFFPAATLFGGHDSPVATALQAEVVNLPNDFRITKSDAAAIGRIVAAFLKLSELQPGARA